jgi:hypothetical protein
MLANAIKLMGVFGDPFERHPPSPKGPGPMPPPGLEQKVKEFWASDENCTVHVLPCDPKIPMDLTLEIRAPKRDTKIECEGWSTWPSSQLSVRDVDPQLTEHEVEEIVWRKIRSLQVVANGPNRYERTLMALRRLVATETPQRRRLLNGQVHEFLAKYIMPYGPPLGRWYFTGKVFRESRRALRKLGVLSAMVAAAGTVIRWLGRGYG